MKKVKSFSGTAGMIALKSAHGLGTGDVAMTQPHMQPEKRSTRRFSFNLPVTVRKVGGSIRELQGHTRDVSSRGAYVYLSSEAEEGATIEFMMTLPAEVTMAEPIRVSCRGKVLRVERSDKKQGIAVAIENYDFRDNE